MKNLAKILIVAAVMAILPASANAVSSADMEQARAIAALWYLRYMNDGSAYLEDLSPKSVSELEPQLKNKEKENIKAFKKVAVPKDYASWDKEKLVEYWGKTAFANLPDEGKRAMPRVRNKINAMQLSATTSNETEAKSEENKEVKEQKTDDPLSLVQDGASDESSTVAKDTAQNAGNDPVIEKEGSSNTLYIVILVILVLVVMGIVVYAVNAMKKGNLSIGKSNDGEQDRRMQKALAEKDAKIKSLQTNIASLNDEIDELRKQLQQQQQPRRNADSGYRTRPISPQNPRTIYLAYANSKGVFVRADGRYNMGNSIFKLVTTDGVSGTFSVIESPEVFDLALTVPADYLMQACTGDNLQLAKGMHEIVTDSPGTAIFEEGKWRVLRKAHIHYER